MKIRDERGVGAALVQFRELGPCIINPSFVQKGDAGFPLSTQLKNKSSDCSSRSVRLITRLQLGRAAAPVAEPAHSRVPPGWSPLCRSRSPFPSGAHKGCRRARGQGGCTAPSPMRRLPGSGVAIPHRRPADPRLLCWGPRKATMGPTHEETSARGQQVGTGPRFLPDTSSALQTSRSHNHQRTATRKAQQWR